MWPFSKKHPPVTHIPEDCWIVAQGEHDGGIIMLRLNQWAWSIRGHPQYQWRLGIAAPIPPEFDAAGINEPGSPYLELEELAQETLEAGYESILVAVLTAATFREMVFHTRDVEAARVKLEGICSRFEGIGAAFVAEKDPGWEVFEELCGGRRPGKRRYHADINFAMGYPRGPGLYYECGKCGQVFPSDPPDNTHCRCRNICFDVDYARLIVRDESAFRVFSTDGE